MSYHHRLDLGRVLESQKQLAAFSPAPPKAASTPMDSNPFTIASYTRIGRVLRRQGAYRDSCAANPTLDSSTQATGGFESFNWKSGLRYLTVTHGTVFQYTQRYI